MNSAEINRFIGRVGRFVMEGMAVEQAESMADELMSSDRAMHRSPMPGPQRNRPPLFALMTLSIGRSALSEEVPAYYMVAPKRYIDANYSDKEIKSWVNQYGIQERRNSQGLMFYAKSAQSVEPSCHQEQG